MSEEPHMVWEHAPPHGEALLVVATSDAEDPSHSLLRESPGYILQDRAFVC